MYLLSRSFLLGVIGVAEVATGTGLLLVPAVVSTLLLGSGAISPEMLLFARVGGAALLCIGIASWLSRSDDQSVALRGLLIGLTIWNGLAAVVLAYAGLALKLTGVLLWPAILIHLLLGAWCLACLRSSGTNEVSTRL